MFRHSFPTHNGPANKVSPLFVFQEVGNIRFLTDPWVYIPPLHFLRVLFSLVSASNPPSACDERNHCWQTFKYASTPKIVLSYNM